MRVTVRKQNVIKSHNEEPKPTYHADCEECGKEIAFTHDDLYVGAYGCVWTKCPYCRKRTYVRCDEEELTLTPDNLVFPQHFASCDGAIKLSINKTNDLCKKAISLSREPESGGIGYAGTGDTIAFAIRDPAETNVYVCKNYYHTALPES